MKTKEFAKLAIKNGYTNERCEGWNWIRENLSELDYIFQTEEYKKQNGYKYKCLPLLTDNTMTKLEKRALETAWYLNNDRVSKQEKLEKEKKYNSEGFYKIENDKKYDNRKIEFIVDTADDNIFGGIVKFKGKLRWSETDKKLIAMKSRSKRSGWWIDNRTIYIKFID